MTTYPSPRAGPLDGALTTSARIGDELDTDNDPSRVYTMQRVHKALDQHEQERMKRGREFQRQMELGAGDAGGVLAEAEELEAQVRVRVCLYRRCFATFAPRHRRRSLTRLLHATTCSHACRPALISRRGSGC